MNRPNHLESRKIVLGAFALIVLSISLALGVPFPTVLTWSATGILAIVLFAATYFDLKFRRIPNRVTYPAIALGVLMNLLASADLSLLRNMILPGFSDSLLGCFTCFGIMIVPYLFSMTGAGDVKLAAAMGAFLGLEAGIETLIIAHLVAAVYGIGVIAFRTRFWETLWLIGTPGTLRAIAQWMNQQCKLTIPMAAFFAIGGLGTVLLEVSR